MSDTSLTIESQTLGEFNEAKIHYQANVARKKVDSDGFLKYLIGLYNRDQKRRTKA